jgi:hypothetical protein
MGALRCQPGRLFSAPDPLRIVLNCRRRLAKGRGNELAIGNRVVANPFNAAFPLLLALDYSRVSAAETRPHGPEIWLLKRELPTEHIGVIFKIFQIAELSTILMKPKPKT